jgi:GT2 family glycosyltransferase
MSEDSGSQGMMSLRDENEELREALAQREAALREMTRTLLHWQMRSPLFYVQYPALAWREFWKGLRFHLLERPQRFLWSHYAKIATGGKRLGNLHQHEPAPLVPERFPFFIPAGEPLKVSIVTPSYNQAQFIGRTIDSVVGQGYGALEYIVMDGASKDHTCDVLAAKAAECPTMQWISEPDRGQSDAIVKGFTRTTGDIMAWLNSDDMLMPGALPFIAEFFRTHPEVDVVYGHRVIVDEDDREIGRWILPPFHPESLTFFDFVPQETLFWRRSAWEKVGGLDTTFQFALDWDLLVRFRDAGCNMVRLPYFTGIFRVHTLQKTSSIIATVGDAEMARIKSRTGAAQLPRDVMHRAVLRDMMRSRLSALALKIGWRVESF